MKTRKDYLDGKCTHAEYYAQFVTPGITARVSSRIGIERLKQSTDQHLNDIPLGTWDNLFDGAPMEVTKRLRECGDYPTKAGLVCIAKTAAFQLINT